ncbi:ATP-binding protein [Actinoplanes sp. NBRC 103695]|uniref:AlbA family DNA-binding domain-containing protein n=1 Tax=Actinoplanes sp. NBRC 103695 TaxID=3032202 RepID=UPI0024A3D49D|nr:ATP-binding protein [Actinoplanes sp. NBRC 103695]GLZ00785.1 hypothetical protein Acsp02_80370 [Actinoplanes sp. NBRC 103695]
MTEPPASVYLGPAHGRWLPRSWADLIAAATAGMLDESPWLDLKKELPAAGARERHNRELAKDIAAMAVDGGVLIIGITDDNSRAGEVLGVPIDGLADRVDLIARNGPSPSAAVRCTAIPDPGRPGMGCLLIEVPPSPVAPHMVDGYYWGRGDRGNRRLTDADVRRIMDGRRQHATDVADLLSQLEHRDPIPAAARQQAHLYLVVRPSTGAEDALVALLDRKTLQQNLLPLLEHVRQTVTTDRLPRADTGRRIGRGAMFGLGLFDNGARTERNLEDLVLQEDGTLTLISAKITDRDSAMFYDADGQPSLRIWTHRLLGTTHSTLLLAGLIGDRHSGYQGVWDIGMRLTGLYGSVPQEARLDPDLFAYDRYDEDAYEQVTTATTAQLVDQTDVIVQRLCGRLLRGLRVEQWWLPYTTDLLRRP